jgi:hypothetical protein
MLVDARAAFDQEPPGGPWHSLAAALVGVAHLLTGDSCDSAKALERAAYLGSDTQPAAAALALAELSLLFAAQDDWRAAQAVAAESRELVDGAGLHDSLFSLLTYVAGGRVAARLGDEEAARRDLASALRLYARPSPAALPWLGAQAALALGHVLLDLDQLADAGFHAAQARRHLGRLLTGGVLGDQQRRLVADAAGSLPPPR